VTNGDPSIYRLQEKALVDFGDTVRLFFCSKKGTNSFRKRRVTNGDPSIYRLQEKALVDFGDTVRRHRSETPFERSSSFWRHHLQKVAAVSKTPYGPTEIHQFTVQFFETPFVTGVA